MKKLMFVLMAGIMACVMTACNGNSNASECANNDSIAVESVDTIVVADSVVACDSIVADSLVNE